MRRSAGRMTALCQFTASKKYKRIYRSYPMFVIVSKGRHLTGGQSLIKAGKGGGGVYSKSSISLWTVSLIIAAAGGFNHLEANILRYSPHFL